jgi:crossover junction endodeoxyribonuclease RuvC
MLRTILSFHDKKLLLDATDALGAALCHFYQSGKPAAAKGAGNWKDFIKKNSDRVIE